MIGGKAIWPFVVRAFAHDEYLRVLTDSGIQMDSGFFMNTSPIEGGKNYEEDSLFCV